MADGEYSGGRTDWERYVVPDMAGFLDEDLGSAWTHVLAWYGTADVAGGYRDALQRIRDGLAAIWPPERSPAALAYLSRMDSMIASLGDTHEAAVSNGGALRGVLETLGDAKRQVDRLHDQWKQNLATVPDTSWEEELNRQAAQLMHRTDATVYGYLPRLVEPRPFQPGLGVYPDPMRNGSGASAGSAEGSSGGGRSVRPPVVPLAPPLSASHPADSRPGNVPPADAGPLLNSGPVPGAGEALAGGSATGGHVPESAPGLAPGSSASPSWFVDTPVGRALRPGGVIGPVPAAGDGLRDPSVGTGSGRPSAMSPAGEPGTPGLMGGGVGGVGGRPGGERYRRRSEPYVVWEMPKGVPAVIEPGPEPKHDPGPGVIGIDR